MTAHTDYTREHAERIAKKWAGGGTVGWGRLSEAQMSVLDECAHYAVRSDTVELAESGTMVIRDTYMGKRGSAEINRAGLVVAEW